MNKDFPYICFKEILKRGRQELINNVLNENPDLYTALYKDLDSSIYTICMELYEVKWLNAHWKAVLTVLEQKNLSSYDRQILISLFAKWYSDFIKQWDYTSFDRNLFDEKMSILRSLMIQNTNWENNLKKVQVSFEKSERILDEKIKELKENI